MASHAVAARTSAKDNVRARWRSAVAVADFGRRGASAGGRRRRRARRRHRRSRRRPRSRRDDDARSAPSPSPRRAWRTRLRTPRGGANHASRPRARRPARRRANARRPWCPRARACPPDERDTLCRKRRAGRSEPEPRPERRGAKRRRCYLLDDLPRSNSRVSWQKSRTPENRHPNIDHTTVSTAALRALLPRVLPAPPLSLSRRRRRWAVQALAS